MTTSSREGATPSTDATVGGGTRAGDGAPRPSRVAMVVVAVVGIAVLGLFLRSAGLGNLSFTQSVLDEDEAVVGPGTVPLDLGSGEVTADLSQSWILRERCPGWVQLTSMDGDATRVHVIATPGVPDVATGRLEPVEDYAAWLASEVEVTMASSEPTSVLGVPATAGRLVAEDGAPREALLAACGEPDGSVGTGIRGPAAGFEQDLVVTTGPVDGLGHVLVLGSAWVGGDIQAASREARRVSASLELVDG